MTIQYQDRPEEAAGWLDSAIVRQAEFAGADAENTVRMRVQRANLMNDLGQSEAALDSLIGLEATARSIAPDEGSPILAETLTWLGRAYWMSSRTDEAEAVFRQALEFRERVMGQDSGVASESRAGVALALILGGDLSQGGPLLESAAESYRSYGMMVPAFMAQIDEVLAVARAN